MRRVVSPLSQWLKGIFNPQWVFEDGSWMEFGGREGLLYGESDGRSMFITIYPRFAKRRCKELYRRDVRRWDSPHHLEELTGEKREEIVQKIADFLQRKNYRLEIER